MNKQSFAVFSFCVFAYMTIACVGEVQDVSDERVGEIYFVGDSAEAEDTTPPPVIALPKGEGGQGGEAGGSGDVGGSDQGMKVMINLAAETPASAIVVGGKNQWVRYSIYDVENVTDQPQQIVGVDIAQGDPNGDVADFMDVGLAVNNVVCFSDSEVYLAGEEEHFRMEEVQEDCNPLVISPKSTMKVEVWGLLAPVMPSAVGGWHEVARSGHTDALRLDGVSLASDPSDTIQGNLGKVNPPSMVLRKSVPIVSKQALPSNTLANVDQDLLKWQETADSAGCVAWKSKVFSVTKSVGLTVSDLRLRRGAQDLYPSSYKVITWKVYTGDGVTYQAAENVLMADWAKGTINVFLMGEDVVCGSGSVYTLHATVSGAVPGSTFDIGVLALPSDNVVTTGSIQVVTNYSVGIKPIAELGGGQLIGSWSTYSDLSEAPHSSEILFDGGSVDWFTGTLVPGSDTLHEHLSL